MHRQRPCIAAWLAATLAGCAPLPTAPTIAVMPPPAKPFEVFQQEDASCRAWAAQGSRQAASGAANAQVASTVAGTAIGTVAGAAAGGHHGPEVGAGVGMATGASYGTAQSAAGAATAQRSYDIAYAQCMAARGNLVPGMPAPRLVPPPAPPAAR